MLGLSTGVLRDYTGSASSIPVKGEELPSSSPENASCFSETFSDLHKFEPSLGRDEEKEANCGEVKSVLDMFGAEKCVVKAVLNDLQSYKDIGEILASPRHTSLSLLPKDGRGMRVYGKSSAYSAGFIWKIGDEDGQGERKDHRVSVKNFCLQY